MLPESGFLLIAFDLLNEGNEREIKYSHWTANGVSVDFVSIKER